MPTLIDVLYSLVIFAASIAAATIAWIVLKGFAKRVAAKTSTPIDDIIIQVVRIPLYISIILVGANLALKRLGVFVEYLRYIDMVFYAVWALLIGYLFYKFVDRTIPALGRRAELPQAPTEVIRRALRWIVVIATAVTLMIIVGVDMGGVISVILLVLGTIIFLAFAAWSIMGNITAGIVLMIWRPFEIGDHIQVEPDGIKGKVEDVNLMFVKVSVPTGEVVHLPNTLVMQKMIRNLSKAGKHLIKLEYKVPTEKDPELVKGALLKAAAATNGLLAEPKPSVRVKELSDDSVTYELSAYTNVVAEDEDVISELRLNVLKQMKEV